MRKSFLSIKGIYYQAEINGQDILWLVPYKFAQNAPIDVDYRIMRTFVDFYQVLVGFVMFRLYTMEGLVYPPKFDAKADSKGAGLRAFTLEAKGVQLLENGANGQEAPFGKDVSKQLKTLSKKIASISTEDTNNSIDETTPTDSNAEDSAALAAAESFDEFKSISETADVLPQPSAISATDPTAIFAPFTFYLSRETPRHCLEFLLRSFGCKRIGWDAVLGEGAFTENEKDPNITHQVVDRPPQQGPGGEVSVVRGGRVPGRIYVQPQYIWDCINAGKLLRPDSYAPGEVLPPHLSPWVKPREGDYDPTAPLSENEEGSEEEEEEVGGAEDGDADEAEQEEEPTKSSSKPKKPAPQSDDDDDDEGEYQGMTIDMAHEDEESPSESEDDSARAAKKDTTSKNPATEDADEELSDSELALRQHQAELEAEALGKPLPPTINKKKKKATPALGKRDREKAEEREMAKIMMPSKKRKLYEKMMYSNKKREAEVKELQDKRRKIEKEERKSARKVGKAGRA